MSDKRIGGGARRRGVPSLFYVWTKIRMDSKNESAVKRFRARLNEFKRPLIEVTLTREGQQETDTLRGVMNQLSSLYALLKYAIEHDGVVPNRESDDPVLKVFIHDAVFDAASKNKALKDELLRYLDIDLHMYPYTLNPNHINELLNTNTDSHPNEIVSNRI
jgi:hypothetical protein